MLAALCERFAVSGDADALVRTDHVFDAFVSALVARAVVAGDTIAPDDEDLAAEEGWIHVPS
jgi:Protein of unknown function (DUF429)